MNNSHYLVVYVLVVNVLRLVIVSLGFFSLLVWVVRRMPTTSPRPSSRFEPRDMWVGLSVFAWCVGLGTAFVILIWLLPWRGVGALLGGLATWIIAPPMMLLIYIYAIAPHRMSVLGAFGMSKLKGRILGDLACAGVAFALCWIMDLMVSRSSGFLGGELPPLDSVVEPILLGSTWLVAIELADMALVSPVLEEVLFRWLLYASLRIRIPSWSAAMISGAIFGLAHGSNLGATLYISTSGVILSMLYERRGSLLPCIIVHSLTNMTVAMNWLGYRILVGG